MKIKCDYCNAYINDYDEKCPNCGAPNEHLVRKAIGSPKTIEELKEWYKQKNLPPEETTRFFIGTDYKKPRAFGIYKDEKTGNFVVYKNKDNGQRAIRYEGKDEAYAVNELYLRLKEEIINQKTLNLNRKLYDEPIRDDGYIDQNAMMRKLQNEEKEAIRRKAAYKKLGLDFIKAIFIYIAILMFLLGLVFIAEKTTHKRGYYNYEGTYYYYQNGYWYAYYDSWQKVSDVPSDLKTNDDDYYSSSYYSSKYDVSDFEDSGYYREPSSSSSSSDDWDSGSSWDSSDSWDSGGTDWSSDW